MLEQAQMMIMTDIEDPFVPLSEGLFVDPYESKYDDQSPSSLDASKHLHIANIANIAGPSSPLC